MPRGRSRGAPRRVLVAGKKKKKLLPILIFLRLPFFLLSLLLTCRFGVRSQVNGTRALDLELSKARQAVALRRAGVAVPRSTVLGGARSATAETLESLAAAVGGGALFSKPDCGGKGFRVQRHQSAAALAAALTDEGDAPENELLLMQEAIEAPARRITRAEFVGGKFLYALDVDTTDGSTALCPADVCERPETRAAPSNCPAGADDDSRAGFKSRFQVGTCCALFFAKVRI